MATTGPKLTIPFTVGAGQIVGQGSSPELWVLYSTAEASDLSPLWNDATAKVRSFSISRGRESELAEINAGTATLTLDNRTRIFDPAFNLAIRSMNRWWLREQFSGETQDLFKGYADSYDQQWLGPVGDAEAIVSCTDEFKVLALDALPLMNPPRDSYADLVMFDDPQCYWRMHDPSDSLYEKAVVGKDLAAIDGAKGVGAPGAIAGSDDAYVGLAVGKRLATTETQDNDPEDIGGTSVAAIELWFKTSDTTPAINQGIFNCPGAIGPNISFQLNLLTTGAVESRARNSGGTVTAASTPALVDNTWYHIVAVVDGSFNRIYLNGAQVAATAHSGVFENTLDPGTFLYLGQTTTTVPMDFDEVALYRYPLPAARVLAHYQAGAQRGFASQLTGARVAAVLDSISSHALRSLQAGQRTLQPVFMYGQSPLGEIQSAEKAETGDGVFFIARDGTVTFLDSAHRSTSPYNTVQATFDDDGTDLPYLDVDVDFSEAFLSNEFNVTRSGGTVQTAVDATSVARYFKRSQSITNLSLTTDASALAIAQSLLAKYKEPLTRILSIALDTSVADVTEAVFRRDLADRIRIFRTAPGGGARIDQSLWIQKISVDGANDGRPWSIRLGLSPV